MLAAHLHRLLRYWMFQVPSKNFRDMRLLSVIDIPFIIAVSPRVWWSTIRGLQQIRAHLKAKTWASLAAVYPRTFIIGYAYLLQAWARYTGTLDDLLRCPDQALVAEVFLRYVCTIDNRIDQVDSQSLSLATYERLTHLPEARAVARELCARIDSLDLPLAPKMKMLRCIARYRRDVATPLIAWVTNPTYDLQSVKAAKEQTTGNLWYTWSRLLGHLFSVPDALAESAANCFWGLGMMLQVLDDLGDTPVDDKLHAQNLFIALARQVPDECQRLYDFLAVQDELFLRWAWVRSNIPTIYGSVMGLYYEYMARVRQDPANSISALELTEMVERLRRLSG